MDLIERQAAIDAFDGVKVDEENCTEYDIGYNDGIDFAISKLSVLPPAQPEPCEDAVSRKAVIDTIDEWKEACVDSGHKETASDIMLIRKDFIELPPVTPKQRTDTLKAEIKRMKRAFKTCINSDYYTGYMSALSAVEGYIAQWEGDAK